MTLNVFSHVNFPFNNKINKIFKKTVQNEELNNYEAKKDPSILRNDTLSLKNLFKRCNGWRDKRYKSL